MANIGFIGLGGMGRMQYESFAAGTDCHIVAGADPAEAARQQFTEAHPQAKLFDDYRRLLREPRLDGVVIAVPTALHAEVAGEALAAGLPVLLEKPMTRTVTEARHLIEAAERAQRLLMVGQCRRYDPVWAAWGEAVRAGRLGRPVLWRHVMAGTGPKVPWFMDRANGGGPLLDGAVHNYDFGQWLWGDPEQVTAQSIKLRPNVTAVDTATATVQDASGDQLMVSWCWGQRGGSLFDVLGPEGSIQIGTGPLQPPEQPDGQRLTYYCFMDTAGNAELLQAPADNMQKMTNQAQHFLDCIAGRATCQSPATEAIKSVAIGEAILQASANGGVQRVTW